MSSREEAYSARYARSEARRGLIEERKITVLENQDTIDDLMGALQDRGVLTGSQAWGIEHEGSDYDFFVPEIVYNYILEIAAENAIDGSYYFKSVRIFVKVPSGGQIEYNIWPVRGQDMPMWQAANNAMGALVESSIAMRDKLAEDKEFRVNLFEQMRDALGIEVIKYEYVEPIEEDSNDTIPW